jgi:hypothetical protein
MYGSAMARFRSLSALLLALCALFSACGDSILAARTPAGSNEASYRAHPASNQVASPWALLAASDDDDGHGDHPRPWVPLLPTDADAPEARRGATLASTEFRTAPRSERLSCVALPRGPPATLHTA